MRIEDKDHLRKLYGSPGERAKNKQLDTLDKHAINFIEKSPFAVISTSNKIGDLDASPRGGKPGFIKIINEQEIIIPDAKGNNRLDSLQNIADTKRIGMLFLIPGMDETLRVNGSAYISTELSHLNIFHSESNPPKACIIVSIEEVFLHCAKALMRSNLWSQESKIKRSELPTMAEMLKDQLGSQGDPETQESMIERYRKEL